MKLTVIKQKLFEIKDHCSQLFQNRSQDKMVKVGIETISDRIETIEITNDKVLNTTELSLQDQTIRKRIPKRVLHFSDGVLEEYSDEDDVDNDTYDGSNSNMSKQVASINPAMLDWGAWFLYQTAFIGSKALGVCDYLGETLANFFGIITPKYQYEIDQYNRMVAEEEEEAKRKDLEEGGWNESNDTTSTIISEPPSTSGSPQKI